MLRRIVICSVAVAAFATVVHAGYMKEGSAKGTVITVGEDRVVVQLLEGGQRTFQAGMKRVADRYLPIEEQLKFIHTLKPGDKLQIDWGRDHTGHFYLRKARKLASFEEPAERQSAAGGDRELKALRAEIAALRREIAELRELICKLVDEKK